MLSDSVSMARPAAEALVDMDNDLNMTDVLSSKLTPSPDALESRVGDETILLHLTNGTYYGLDALGTRIWELLKDGASPREICALIAREYETPIGTVEADTRKFLADLKAHSILVDE